MKLTKLINGALAFGVLLSANTAMAQVPVRDPHAPGYVKATELPDGTIPTPDSYGNFIIGPTHDAAPEMTVQPNVPQGEIFTFTMESKDSKIFPGIVRDRLTYGKPDSTNPAKLIVTTSHPGPY